MSHFLAESLPGLLREWLARSGGLPLTIFFNHFGCSNKFYLDDASSEDDSDDSTAEALEVATGLVVEILNLHSGRWRKLHLNTGVDIFRHFSGSIQPKQLVDIALSANSSARQPRSTAEFIMKLEPNPTHLKLNYFPLASINVGWGNITHATFSGMSTEEGVDFLRRAPSLEFYHVSIDALCSPRISFETPVIHPRLHSFYLFTPYPDTFLEAINLPSLGEWTQNMDDLPVPVNTVLSLLERSRCCLKILNLEAIASPPGDLSALLQAMPSLERLELSFDSKLDIVRVDDLIRIFSSAPGKSNILMEDTASECFLPHLQYFKCVMDSLELGQLSWGRIQLLYRQGHRRSLTLRAR
jgi:hypothetical protein